jgi:hypothetical protein
MAHSPGPLRRSFTPHMGPAQPAPYSREQPQLVWASIGPGFDKEFNFGSRGMVTLGGIPCYLRVFRGSMVCSCRVRAASQFAQPPDLTMRSYGRRRIGNSDCWSFPRNCPWAHSGAETFGKVLLEAMASGLPSVVAAAGGPTELAVQRGAERTPQLIHPAEG